MNQRNSICLCKKDAKKALASYRMRFPLLLLFALSAFAFLGITYVASDICCWLFGAFTANMLGPVISILGAVFFLAPLWRGLNAFPIYSMLSEEADIRMLFFFFSHKRRYCYAIRRTVRGIFRIVFFFALLIAVASLGRSVAEDLLKAGESAVALLVLLLSVFFSVLLVVAFARWRQDLFLLDYIFLSSPLLTYRQARTLSARRMRCGCRDLRQLNASFLPLWLLSVLGLGIPLVFVIPYYIVARGRLSVLLMKI